MGGVLVLAAAATGARAQSLAEFTYQGRLSEQGVPANGLYDMQFRLLTVGGDTFTTMCAESVEVVDGLFTVVLDPGALYPYSAHQATQLEISVRAEDGSQCDEPLGYATLSPRQTITPAPMATRSTISLLASSAMSLDGHPVSYFTNPGNLAGPIPDEKLSANVVLTNVSPTFSQAATFVERVGIGAPASSSLFEVWGHQGTAVLASTQSTHGSVLTLENHSQNLETGSYLGAINFGITGNTPGQFGYVKGSTSAADTMQFRVGGVQSVAISGAGRLGVGTNAPATAVHIANGLSTLTPHSATLLSLESQNGAYLSLLSSNGAETGLLFGRPFGGNTDAGIIFNNPAAQGGLQFRTGGNITRMTIDGSGTVRIPGTINAGNLTASTLTVDQINYSSPKVSYKTIGIGSFTVIGGASNYSGLDGQRIIGSGFASLEATVDLPHGAIITNITAWVWDVHSVGDLSLTLYGITYQGAVTIHRNVTTAGAAGFQAIDLSPTTPLTVNNNTGMLEVGIGMANLTEWNHGLAVQGLRITYTQPSP
jgi:hypothetical protein